MSGIIGNTIEGGKIGAQMAFMPAGFAVMGENVPAAIIFGIGGVILAVPCAAVGGVCGFLLGLTGS